MTPIERYWAGLEAGDPDMMAVCSVLTNADCDVVEKVGYYVPRTTSAVSALNRAIKSSGEKSVTQACRIISDAWPGDKRALAGVLITSVSRVIKRNSRIDCMRLQETLMMIGREQLTANAETVRKISGGDAPAAISRTICELYNRGLRINQISADFKSRYRRISATKLS